MATDTEILNDIQHIYKKIDQCYRSKTDITSQINKQREDIIGLQLFIQQDEVRLSEGKKPRYDAESMLANIVRCKDNIVLFEQTIEKEDQAVAKFLEIVKILQDDMARPKEITIDMSEHTQGN
jgi:hypothetical protein